MHIPRLVCGPCLVEMTVESNSVVIELASENGHAFKVSSDMYRCPSCKISTALTARAAIAEAWQEGYSGIPAQFTACFADEFRRGVRYSERKTA